MAWNNPSEECFDAFFRDLGTTRKKVEEDAQVLKQWLNSQPHLPHTDANLFPNVRYDFIIQNVLIRNKCSIERAKQNLDMHFTLKTALPEFFTNRDPLLPEMKHAYNTMDIIPLPRVTKEGYRVTIFRPLDKNPSEFRMEHILKMAFMMADIRVQEDMTVGDIYVNDFSNISITYVSKLSMSLLKKMEICLRDCYCARVKGVHFINAPSIIEVVMALVKSVMSAKMSSRHHVHSSLDSLYQHLDKDIMPEDYGGNEKKYSELRADWLHKVDGYRDYFHQQDMHSRVDESKRPGKTVDTDRMFGIEGSFRKLTVD